MLVLSRKVQEEIYLVDPNGKRITIKLNKIHPRGATLGIDAPSSYTIYRKEVYDREVQEARKKGHTAD